MHAMTTTLTMHTVRGFIYECCSRRASKMSDLGCLETFTYPGLTAASGNIAAQFRIKESSLRRCFAERSQVTAKWDKQSALAHSIP